MCHVLYDHGSLFYTHMCIWTCVCLPLSTDTNQQEFWLATLEIDSKATAVGSRMLRAPKSDMLSRPNDEGVLPVIIPIYFSPAIINDCIIRCSGSRLGFL